MNNEKFYGSALSQKNVELKSLNHWLLKLCVAGIILIHTGCALIPLPSDDSSSGKRPCSDRIGRCFDATIGGQPVVVIADEKRYEELKKTFINSNDGWEPLVVIAEEKRFAGLKRISLNSGLSSSEVYWEVTSAVDGKSTLDIRVSSNELGKSHVGEPKKAPEVMIYPLDNQQIKCTQQMAASDNVFINLNKALMLCNNLAQEYLPPGRYVIAITYNGVLNWERKHVLITVK
jgi:hypothetical protein